MLSVVRKRSAQTARCFGPYALRNMAAEPCAPAKKRCLEPAYGFTTLPEKCFYGHFYGVQRSAQISGPKRPLGGKGDRSAHSECTLEPSNSSQAFCGSADCGSAWCYATRDALLKGVAREFQYLAMRVKTVNRRIVIETYRVVMGGHVTGTEYGLGCR